ncbi:hypothetical protein IU448_21015 [Nocardia flavorosea]|uniref:hypothetical protein n=1 Tax=Nocardia flavorosea TaxID=53429 RepID=UPI00189580B3|nr:hypothetical protein [Nocardia flavorosea]MBF6351472.1 hypothetical protein [Nocardia flavorosea]
MADDVEKQANINDAEKRWSSGTGFRRAVRYTLTVLGIAALVCAATAIWSATTQCRDADSLLCDTPAQLAVLFGPGAVLFLGGIGAFVETIRVWRRGGTWPIWQGAGWFLLLITLFYLGIGATTVPAG